MKHAFACKRLTNQVGSSKNLGPISLNTKCSNRIYNQKGAHNFENNPSAFGLEVGWPGFSASREMQRVEQTLGWLSRLWSVLGSLL